MKKAPICQNCKKEYPSCGIFAMISGMNVCSEHEPKDKLPSEILKDMGFKPAPRIIKVKNMKDRVETGPTQFNNDWPGIFIRGDNAGWYAMELEHLLYKIENKEEPGFLEVSCIKGLIDLLKSSRV